MKRNNCRAYLPFSTIISCCQYLIPYLLTTIYCLLLLAGCAPKAVEILKEIRPRGDNVICILTEDSKFKSEVIIRLKQSLSDKGFIVITDKRKRAYNYNPRDYGAIVYMTEFWVWHTPWHAKQYYSKHHQPSNVIFVVTSGDPNVTIKKPFDAITSASKMNKVEQVSNDIMVRLDGILGKGNK